MVRLSVVMLIIEVNMGCSTLIHCCELMAEFGFDYYNDVGLFYSCATGGSKFMGYNWFGRLQS